MPHRARPAHSWWLLTLAGLGGLSLCTVILTLFFPFGRRPPAVRITAAPPVTSSEFLVAVPGAAGAPVRAGGTIQLLDNGVALLRDLNAARRTIHFSVYIWEPGQTSDQVFAVLIDRAKSGVAVRLLIDGLGGMKVPDKDVAALKAAGGQVATFSAPRFGKLTRFDRRDHRRAIVVDGTVAYTGGMAVADKWMGDADTDQHWRDTMVRVTGPLAASVQSAFVAPWAQSSGELLAGPGVFPPPEPSADPAPDARRVTLHMGLSSSPSSEDHPLRVFFIQSFVSARRTLHITTPYFVPDEGTREVVAARARAGVDVRLLLPDQHTDARPIRLTSHAYYERLLESGVRIYEYQGTMMHTKGVVVDGVWSIVGSANMDIRSKELNSENVLGVLDEGFGRDMEATFSRDLRHAREISLAEWRRRGPWERAKERMAVLFSEQY